MVLIFAFLMVCVTISQAQDVTFNVKYIESYYRDAENADRITSEKSYFQGGKVEVWNGEGVVLTIEGEEYFFTQVGWRKHKTERDGKVIECIHGNERWNIYWWDGNDHIGFMNTKIDKHGDVFEVMVYLDGKTVVDKDKRKSYY